MSASNCLACEQSVLQFHHIFADGLAHIADGAIHILDSFVGVLAKYIQLIGQAVNLGPLRREHRVDVIEHLSYLPLIRLASHTIQVCQQRAGISADFMQFASHLGDQSVGVVGNDRHLVGDLVQARGLLRRNRGPWR